MVRRNRARSSSLFLMELIIAILFFSASSAVCVQFFVKSHILSQNAQRLNHAVNECSGIAEIVSTSSGIDEAVDLITGLYPDASVEVSSPPSPEGTEENVGKTSVSARIYYNEAFIPCAEGEGRYVLEAALWEQGRTLTVGMTMMGEEEAPIYELTVKHYLQREG